MTITEDTGPNTGSPPGFDIERVRQDFPILGEEVWGKPLVYLDNAATTQKPNAVIDAISEYYRSYNSNIHRGVHSLSQKATDAYEGARDKIARYIGAPSRDEVIFVRGTTEAVNLVAQSFVRGRVGEGDEIVITGMEHHSNIVPWQIVREQTGCVLRVVPFDDRGVVDVAAFESMLGPRTRFASLVHVSNALGTINPVGEMSAIARRHGVPVFIDGAQAAGHLPVDIAAIGCDFYAISGHKLYGPTGIGALWGRRELLDAMPPYHGGGEMITSVTFEESKYNHVPNKFEAGTPNIAGTIGLGAAIEYLEGIGLDRVHGWEEDLLHYATERAHDVDGLTLIGTSPQKAGILSFTLESAHPHDVGTILDREGVAVRTGHHCAQPIMARYGVPATVRASFGLYNTHAEIDALFAALGKVKEIFG